jgi:hypothetical protein
MSEIITTGLFNINPYLNLILEFDTYDRYGSQYINRGFIDAEAELIALLTQELAAEIDRANLNNLIKM